MARIPSFVIAVAISFGLATLAPLTLAQDKGDSKKGGPDQVQTDKGMTKGKPDKADRHDKVKPTKAKHHNGKDLVGDKIKTDGHHEIHKNGNYTAAVDVKDGKIAGMKVKHATKGDVAVTKYKTSQKMAGADQQRGSFQRAAFVQVQYLGTTYIGYAYVDEYGTEVIYWYPYDMILDGDTGAVEYVPAY